MLIYGKKAERLETDYLIQVIRVFPRPPRICMESVPPPTQALQLQPPKQQEFLRSHWKRSKCFSVLKSLNGNNEKRTMNSILKVTSIRLQ